MSNTKFEKIEDIHQTFIEEQKMFFAATAASVGRINMAPKDTASLRVMGPNRIVWVNLTGAENETGAHLAESPRMTLMWCSFDQKPMILRAYGKATLIHPRDEAWSDLIELFPLRHGSRQVIDLAVDFVLKSCGFGVPLYDFVAHRDTLRRWEDKKDDDGVRQHWADYNQFSIDGKPTDLLKSNQ
jgi:hypothetical protein